MSTREERLAKCPGCYGAGTIPFVMGPCAICGGTGERPASYTAEPAPAPAWHVVYHRADFDGHLSGAICRHFLLAAGRQVVMHGFDYGDPVPAIPRDECVYVVDLAVSELMTHPNLLWIDHHKSSIEKYPESIAGWRIDGVAASRLCWAWFAHVAPVKNLRLEHFKERAVDEPELVRLVGEYDVWDKRDPDAETLQYGLRIYGFHAETTNLDEAIRFTPHLLEDGRGGQRYTQAINASVVRDRAYELTWHGLRWLVLNTAYGNSLTFSGHERLAEADALMMWRFDGAKVAVSLYQAPHRTDLDLSTIALEYGGGGHRGACGFTLSLGHAAAIFNPHLEQLTRQLPGVTEVPT